jgi:hypothetical protein
MHFRRSSNTSIGGHPAGQEPYLPLRDEPKR